MDSSSLRRLSDAGHTVGLHSHRHPTMLSKLSVDSQRDEYNINYQAIKEITGNTPDTMSHPCNSYSADTIEILNDLGVQLGFRANMGSVKSPSRFEFPREDHANILNSDQFRRFVG